MYDNYNNKTAFNLYTYTNWFEDKSGLWYVDYSKEGKTYKTIGFQDFKAQHLFDHKKVAAQLSAVLDKEINSMELSLSNIEKTATGDLSFKTAGKAYLLNLKTYDLKEKAEEKKEEENEFESQSPDKKWIAYTKDYNLYIKSTTTDEVVQLTFDGVKNYEYASWYGWYDKMEGENGERPAHFYVDWSEDSKWIKTSVVDLRKAEKMYLLDWSIDTLYKPKLLSYYRGSPGDTTMVHAQPVFFDIENRKQVKIDLPKNTHINNVSTRWSETSGLVYANYPERGYQKEYVKLVDLNTTKVKTLITETSNTNIDNFTYRVLDDKQQIIFLSERSGWRQLYAYDLKTGQTKALTKGNYYINSIAHIDEEGAQIYFTASGKDANLNPYHRQLYRVSLAGKTTLLTPENAHHSIAFSKDGKYFVDNYSTINQATKTVLRASKTGKILTQMTQANIKEAIAMGWEAPQTFEFTAKDGKTTLYGALWKPTNFDPAKSYPIIDATYTGPHTQRFPKMFSRIFSNQSLAELGFIVMAVDGLGTSGRSKAFHNHSYKNMGNNLEDHVLAIQYLGEKYTWIDANRAGIHGHSAGGYDTGRALLAFPEVYKVGVSSSADHDFRMEKAWWPEMYQGWPIDSTYHKVSNITNAKNLQGKLLLVHGGIDENVNPSATFKLAEALIRADKEFDLLIMPSQRHGYRGLHRKYFLKKRWNYFVQHLRGVQPIWEFEWEVVN
jgi:dipeptidyl aminopeptidase/acylaminoacyl peptidase